MRGATIMRKNRWNALLLSRQRIMKTKIHVKAGPRFVYVADWTRTNVADVAVVMVVVVASFHGLIATFVFAYYSFSWRMGYCFFAIAE